MSSRVKSTAKLGKFFNLGVLKLLQSKIEKEGPPRFLLKYRRYVLCHYDVILIFRMLMSLKNFTNKDVNMRDREVLYS